MNFKTNTAKIAGNPDNNGCSQSYDITPEHPEKLNTHGELYLSVSIKDITDNSQSIFVIRGVVAQIQKKFYENKDDGVLSALSKAINSTVETYQKEIEIASAVLLKDNAYIVTCGTAEVLLRRNNKIAVFRSPNGALFKSSGKLKSEDMLILATKSFLQGTSAGVLNAALEKGDTQKIVDFLAPSIQSKDNSSSMCASFIHMQREDSPQTAEMSMEYPKINTPETKEDVSSDNTQAKSIPTQRQEPYKQPERKQENFSPKKGILDKIRSKKFYIKDFQDEKANKRRRVLTFAGLALMLVLAGTVTYGLYQKQEKERQEKVDEIVSTIEKDLQEAEEIFSYSPQRSQELVERSRQELKKLENPDLKAQSKLAALSERIDQAEGSVLGMHNAQADDFLDLDLLSSDFSGNKSTVYGSELYILDTDNDRLISVDVSNKRSEILAGQDVLQGVKDVAVWSTDYFVLKDDGIYDLDNNKLLDAAWSNNTLIRSYAGNVYLLDKGDSEIVRYAISDGNLTSRTNWLSDEVSADFSRIVSWGIDGAIWLSSESGSIFKYTYGYQQNFTLGKVAPEITSGAIVYASSDNENIYLLDKENARILVFDKEGSYKEQYNQDLIKDARDIAVFESEGKIILLTGDKLKHIDIK